MREAWDESGSWCRRQSDDSSNLGCERETNEEYANAGRAQTSLNSKQSKWNSSVEFLRTNPESLNSDIPQFVSTQIHALLLTQWNGEKISDMDYRASTGMMRGDAVKYIQIPDLMSKMGELLNCCELNRRHKRHITKRLSS